MAKDSAGSESDIRGSVLWEPGTQVSGTSRLGRPPSTVVVVVVPERPLSGTRELVVSRGTFNPDLEDTHACCFIALLARCRAPGVLCPGRTSQHEIPPAAWPMKRRAPDGNGEVGSAAAEHASRVRGELLCTSHSRTRSSSPPVTTCPSGSTATAPTPSSWRPSSTGPAPGSAGSPHQHPPVVVAAGDHPSSVTVGNHDRLAAVLPCQSFLIAAARARSR
jgi:hypothetical protein